MCRHVLLSTVKGLCVCVFSTFLTWMPWERVWWSHSIKLWGENSMLSSCFPLVPFNHRHGTRQRERDCYIKWWHAAGPWGGRERDESPGLSLHWSTAETLSFLPSLFLFCPYVFFLSASLSSPFILCSLLPAFIPRLLSLFLSTFCDVLTVRGGRVNLDSQIAEEWDRSAS